MHELVIFVSRHTVDSTPGPRVQLSVVPDGDRGTCSFMLLEQHIDRTHIVCVCVSVCIVCVSVCMVHLSGASRTYTIKIPEA